MPEVLAPSFDLLWRFAVFLGLLSQHMTNGMSVKIGQTNDFEGLANKFSNWLCG